MPLIAAGVAAGAAGAPAVPTNPPAQAAVSNPPTPSSAASNAANDLERFDRTEDGVPRERQIVEATLPTPPLRLAILPDRTTGRAWGLPYLEAAVEDLRRIGPDAIFTIGDMVQGYTRSVDRWDREVEEWREIAAGLPAPAWPVAGNHDVVSGTRDPRDDTFERRYRERFGPLRYAVEFDRGTVVVAYSEGRRGEEGVALSPEDLAWLDDTLARAAARNLPTVLLTHRPMWRYRSANWDERVHPMLVEHGVDAVVAGHFHALQRDADRDGVQYHVLGACGGLIDQHPASGQLHHLTFLSMSPAAPRGDRVRLHHQLVGATLPPDAVQREDQDRAWRLKRADEAARIVGAIVETAKGTESSGTLRLDLANPLDVPVVWTWRPLDGPPTPAPVRPTMPGGLAWSSMTPVDTFNPFTMPTDSPLDIESGGPVELAPSERRSVDLVWSVKDHAGPLPPTELRLEATFRDARGRDVPVTAIRRVPIARERPLGIGEQLDLPISAWEFSPYDLLEPDPAVILERFDDGSLRIVVSAPEDRIAEETADPRLDEGRLEDPMHDAIRIDLGEGDARRTLLFEILPSTEELRIFEASRDAEGDLVLSEPPGNAATRPTARRNATKTSSRGWVAEVHLRDAFMPNRSTWPLQIGVADNDDTYHTQWRWLAPNAHPLRLEDATLRADAPESGE